MIQIGKTVYLFTEGTYIFCEDDTITFKLNDGRQQRLAFHVVSQIIIFYRTTLSSYIMYQCSKHNIIIIYISPHGKYYGQFNGELSGNVLLRKKQFDMIDTQKATEYVRTELAGKFCNSIWLLKYCLHHNTNKETIQQVVHDLQTGLQNLQNMSTIDDMRILEANMASRYFSIFDLLLKNPNEDLKFMKRTQHPPQNNCNAVLSLFYTMMTAICESALKTRGLDSECGYLHVLRSGRHSLACDLVEEFRSCVVDRFIITLINRKEIISSDFISDTQGIRLSDDARKKIFQKWENYLDNTVVHYKLYDKKLSLRIVVYEQAQLLAQYIRGDISAYPPFIMQD